MSLEDLGLARQTKAIGTVFYYGCLLLQMCCAVKIKDAYCCTCAVSAAADLRYRYVTCWQLLSTGKVYSIHVLCYIGIDTAVT